MLNIAPVAADAGAVDYYLRRQGGCRECSDHAQDRVDYYAGKVEAPGMWLGSGAERAGLVGKVDPEQFRALLMEATTPDGKVRVGPRMRLDAAGKMADTRVAGMDCTFRAPKSVSLLYAFGNETDSALVRGAHDHAAAEAVRYLEGVAGYGRRGRDRRKVEGRGFLAAGFRHRDARPVEGAASGDPLIHTHVVIANLVEGADGKWSALPTAELYRHAKTAGYVYQAVLRERMTRDLGVAWRPVRNGTADVEGISRGVIEHFSRRRGEITAEMERRGEEGAGAAQAATLSTRSGKLPGADDETLRDRWEAHGAAVRFGPEQVAELLAGPAQVSRVGTPAKNLAPDLLGPDGLTRQSSTFYRRDVLRELAAAAPAGASLDELQTQCDVMLGSADVVQVAPVGHDDRYTTRGMLQVEAHVMALGDQGQGADVGRVAGPVVERALRSVPRELGADQAAMVRGLLTSGRGVEVVQAPAGTGKTTALSAARIGWEAAGYRVVGASTAARAARELSDGGGIESSTLARLLADVEATDGGGFRAGTVLVVDEAGMVGSRALDRVLTVAARDQAKVVLVGDCKQLPEIDAGGTFRALGERLGAYDLTENRRQSADWEREALQLLRDGRAGDAVGRYVDHGRVTVSDTAAGARAALVSDWWQSEAEGEALRATHSPEQDVPGVVGPPPVMLAARKVDVADLNRLGRAMMAGAGRLSGETLTTGAGVELQAGDRVVCIKNDRRIGVQNGSRGTVESVQDGALSVRLERGDRVTVPPRYLAAGHVDHGYAITGHKGQGMTTGRAFVLGVREALYQEWGYVAMSRAKDLTRLYLVTGASTDLDHDLPRGRDRDAVEQARWALAQSKARSMASESLDIPEIVPGSDADLRDRLLAGGELLRSRPSALRDGADQAEAWTTEHAPELASVVAAGDELAWQGKAARVADQAEHPERVQEHERVRGRSR